MQGHRFEIDAPWTEEPFNGMLSGLEDAYSENLLTTDDIIDLMLPFQKMKDPMLGHILDKDEDAHYKFFFTEKGYSTFKDSIGAIESWVSKHNGKLIHTTETVSDKDIIYKDKHQFAILR